MDNRQREIEHLEDERRQLQASLGIAYDDRLAGRIDASYFEQRAENWGDRIAIIQREVADLEAAIATTPTNGPTRARHRTRSTPGPVEGFRSV